MLLNFYLKGVGQTQAGRPVSSEPGKCVWGVVVPGQGMQREAESVGFYHEGLGPNQAPRKVLLMLLAPPTPHATLPPCTPVPPAWPLCDCWFSPTSPSPALTRSIACPQPDSGGQLAPWALPSPDSPRIVICRLLPAWFPPECACKPL